MSALVALSVWIGTYAPPRAEAKAPASESKTLDAAVAVGGSIVVQSRVPKNRPMANPNVSPWKPNGDVLIVQPLLGIAIHARSDFNTPLIELAGIVVDRRPNHADVIVLDAVKPVIFLVPTADDIAAIKAVLAKQRSLENVKRALDTLEVGLADIDGDKKPDLASTYGCTVWGDGNCQVTGQVLLVHDDKGWSVLDY